MILKTFINDEDKWWFVDNIERLSYTTVEQSKIQERLESVTMSSFDMSTSPEKGCIFVCFRQSNGIEQLYALNDITYLLNDSGKTIERIW